jgi:hypothetical protein
MQVNVIDAYITFIKLSEGLKTTVSQYGGSGTFNRQTGFDHLEYMRELEEEKKSLLANPSPNSYRRLQELNEEITTMRNSPLSDFKRALDQTLGSEKFSRRINALELVKDNIQADKMQLSMMDLKLIINEVMKGVIRPELVRSAFNVRRYKRIGF